jgi:hypothetical protein
MKGCFAKIWVLDSLGFGAQEDCGGWQEKREERYSQNDRVKKIGAILKI